MTNRRAPAPFVFDLGNQDDRILGNHAKQAREHQGPRRSPAVFGRGTARRRPRSAERHDKCRPWRGLGKLCSCSMRSVNIRMIIRGTTAMTDARLSALSSATPPSSMRYPAGIFVFNSAMPGVKIATMPSARAPSATSACTVSVGMRPLAPDERLLLLGLEGCELAERNSPAVSERDLERLQIFKRNTIFLASTRHHIDEINAVPQLGNPGSADGRVENRSQRLAGVADAPRLILVDPDAHPARRLDPVEAHPAGVWDVPAIKSATPVDRSRSRSTSGPTSRTAPANRRAARAPADKRALQRLGNSSARSFSSLTPANADARRRPWRRSPAARRNHWAAAR